MVVPSGVGSIIIINVLFLFSFSSVEQIIQCTVDIATNIIMCVCVTYSIESFNMLSSLFSLGSDPLTHVYTTSMGRSGHIL